MEDFLRKARHTDDLHKNPPDFRRLEVKGTWSGNVDEPVNLRISLEVNKLPLVILVWVLLLLLLERTL